MRRSWHAYALLAPIFLLLIVFVYYPPLLGLTRAFYSWSPGNPAVFVGLKNFQDYFTYSQTPGEFVNLLKLLCVLFAARVVVPFLMAEAIFAVRARDARELYRLLTVLPILLPGIVTILLWRNLYDPQLGPINTLLQSLGLGAFAHDWLGEPTTAIFAIAAVGFPWVAGIGTLIYLGGLGQISDSIFEACRLDGCVGFQRILLVDLALLLRQVRLLTILAIIEAATAFETILVLTDGGPGFASTVPALTMYHRAFGSGEFGYGSAIGLLLFVMTLCGTFLLNKLMRPYDEVI
jgi:raffinose/stachyose/melibiose transport system permease protein